MKKSIVALFERLLPLLLIASFVLLGCISLLSIRQMQGSARVINYAGIVRGGTQRLVKQELHREQNDALLRELDEIIAELAGEEGSHGLIRLDSPAFQENIARMRRDWAELKAEIAAVRAGGDAAALYERSEAYFELANDTVAAAEEYAESRVRGGVRWLLLLDGAFILLSAAYWAARRRQRRMARELRAAEDASREKSAFLSRMSHEIRTPMNGIIGMTELAERSLGDRERLRDCLRKIRLSSQYLLSLINDILDMSRIENGRVELYEKPFDLRALADRLSSMFGQKAQEAGLRFELETRLGPEPVVLGDELRFTQVVVNLLSNALKFTPSGGSVRVEIEQREAGAHRCALTVTVEDTGIGMQGPVLEKIFEPFEQADPSISHRFGGTGLGLAISRRLIELMGGSISVRSEPGKGSSFVVKARMSTAEAVPGAEAGSSPAGPESDLGGLRILLAEDNALNAEIALTLLELEGARVDLACNGREAVALFLKEPAAYSAILMDIRMPEMDGLEACRAIRDSRCPQGARVPIIGLSANAFAQDVKEALDCGMDDYASKPFEMPVLKDKLRRAVARLRDAAAPDADS